MSCLDLIARHYSLRTTGTIVYPTVNIPSARSTRFEDGEGMSWMFLQLSQYFTNFGWDTAGIGGSSELIERGVSGDRKGKDGNEEEIMEQALVEQLKQHCASPRWSINLEFDNPRALDAPELKSEQGGEGFLHRIVSLKPDATVDKVECMFLDPTNTASEEGRYLNKADPGYTSGLEGCEVRDGRAWFARRFPSRAALVEHEEVWMVIKKPQKSGLDGAMDEEEVCGCITTLADSGLNEEAGDRGDRRRRMYIFSLLVYPSYRRRGLGRTLLRYVIARAKSSPQGPALVCLTVFAITPGRGGCTLLKDL